jgi:hypothetical protein
LPDGTSEIFLREGMDRFSRATTDLPRRANQSGSFDHLAGSANASAGSQASCNGRHTVVCMLRAIGDEFVPKVSGAIKTSGAR